MKIIRFACDQGAIHTGCDFREGTATVCAGDWETGFTPTDRRLPVARLLAPLTPPNIWAIGLNYADHAAETGLEIPRFPTVFSKATSSVIGPGEAIVPPRCALKGPETDYEAELAVVIGRKAKDVPADEALSHVAGYCCANDVSARRWQKHGGSGQWVRAKSFDTFCPLGPHVVTANEIADPQDLEITTWVNDTPVQQGHTRDMLFPVAELISFLSQDTTLLPGTVILTGTPAGVGFTRTPRLFLQSGDTVRIHIAGIGTLENPVR